MMLLLGVQPQICESPRVSPPLPPPLLAPQNCPQRDVYMIPPDGFCVRCTPAHTDETQRSALDGQRFCALDVEVLVQRKATFYFANVVAIFCIIVVLSFSSFAVESDIQLANLSDRISITLNMARCCGLPRAVRLRVVDGGCC